MSIKTKSQHTPGPWIIVNENIYYKPFAERPLTKEHLLAHVSAPQALLNSAPEDYVNEWEANARLIAAAPELLEALKELNDEIQSNYIGTDANDSEGSMERTLIELCKQADKAIAKAEGKE